MAEEYIWVMTGTATVKTQPETSELATGDGKDSRDSTLSNPFTKDDLTSLPSRPGFPVSVEKLERGVNEFLGPMGRVLKTVQARAGEMGGMELDEIQLSVEVNGEGQLSLLGSGTKVGGSGGLTLTFKRPQKLDVGERYP